MGVSEKWHNYHFGVEYSFITQLWWIDLKALQWHTPYKGPISRHFQSLTVFFFFYIPVKKLKYGITLTEGYAVHLSFSYVITDSCICIPSLLTNKALFLAPNPTTHPIVLDLIK